MHIIEFIFETSQFDHNMLFLTFDTKLSSVEFFYSWCELVEPRIALMTYKLLWNKTPFTGCATKRNMLYNKNPTKKTMRA